MKFLTLLPSFLLVLAATQGACAFSSVARVQILSTPPSINPVHYRPSSSVILHSTNGDANTMDDGNDSDKKVEGRKKRVIVGYQSMMMSYLTVGLLSASKAGFSLPLLHMVAGYLALPAGISYIMISAAKHDRLSSETYKRLNLALLEYGIVGLSVVALSTRRNAMLAFAFILSVINSLKGYVYGVLGWDKQNGASLTDDIVKGTKETVRGFVSIPKNLKSFGYLVSAWLIASFKLMKLYEIAKFIQTNSVTAELAMILARFNRLALLTIMNYTLKDAADRDRLGGTTFIQMNYLCSIAMGVQAAFYTGGLSTPVGALSSFFAAFFAFNGISSYMKNQYA